MKKSLLTTFFISFTLLTFASSKEAIKSGNWNDPKCWSPSGIPSVNDEIIISNSFDLTINTTIANCKSIIINSGSELIININSNLTVSGISGITLSGILCVNGSLNCVTYGSILKINDNGKLIWNPQYNDHAHASIFTNCIEDLDAFSTICIKKWFDNIIGFGQYISGDIGNLSIENIPKWNMMNTLETHSVKGKLTIKNSYVILDSMSLIRSTSIGEIELLDANSILDIHSGDHDNSFTLSTNNLLINAGQFTLLNKTGEGSSKLVVNNDITVSNMGIFTGSYGNDGNIEVYVGGKITLNKSYFYGCYSGNGNFKLNVSSDFNVQKSGAMFSEFHGIYNGTGNVNVNINGNFNHQGYSDLILNDGINGFGIGNAKLKINGKYQQNSGDFRCIYNLTSYDAGTINMECNEVDFTGGIFIMYYACSNQNLENNFSIRNGANINFTGNNDVFRFNGLSNLNGTHSNCKLRVELNGPITINGNNNCELNTNTSYGDELIISKGYIKINGGGLKLNYSDHTTIWDHTGNLQITNGINNFSANTGNTIINFNGNLLITGGITNLKSNNGNSNFTVKGNFLLSGGNINLYNNLNHPLQENISLNIEGDFIQQNGIINFNSNVLSNGSTNLNIEGESYSLQGGSIITADLDNYNYFGNINFNSSKKIQYYNSGLHNLHQIKQTIKTNSRVEVKLGDFIISAGLIKSFEYLKLDSNSTLELNEAQVIGNANNQNTGILLSNFATIHTKRKDGFYNSNGTAALSSQSGMDYFLSPQSNIVYCGSNLQTVTNYSNNDHIESHKYGNLIIDKSSTTKCNIFSNEITVRNQLVLRSGELNIADHTLTIENGNTDAIVNQNGYINCGLIASNNKGNIFLKNISAGKHHVNFGEAENKITPLALYVKSGIGNSISISTNSTSIFNTPYPISNLNSSIQIDNAIASNQLIDRIWYINAPNTIMDIECSYLGAENTTPFLSNKNNFSAKLYSNGNWSTPIGNGRSTTNGIGYVKASGITCNGAIILCVNGKYANVRFNDFSAVLKENFVELNWSTLEEDECKDFVIERSSNNIDFEEIEMVSASGNSNQEKSYKSFDNNPLKGISFYRIRNKSNDGNYVFTESKLIDNVTDNSMEVFPVPFTNDFTAEYNCDKKGSTTISIINSIGQIMFLTQRNDDAGKNTFHFSNSSKLKPGTYFLNVISGTKKLTKKIIKSTN
jgi:hypothetical protein